MITFLTYAISFGAPYLQYGTHPFWHNETATFSLLSDFTDSGAHHIRRFSYSLSLTRSHLPLNTTIYYVVAAGNTTGTYYSPLLNFTTLHDGVGRVAGVPLRIAMIGDYGLVNGEQTHASLERAVQRRQHGPAHPRGRSGLQHGRR